MMWELVVDLDKPNEIQQGQQEIPEDFNFKIQLVMVFMGRKWAIWVKGKLDQ